MVQLLHSAAAVRGAGAEPAGARTWEPVPGAVADWIGGLEWTSGHGMSLAVIRMNSCLTYTGTHVYHVCT